MDAKDYLSGVYLDTKKFSKKEVVELMEDYFKYKTKYNEQVVKKLIIPVVSSSYDKNDLRVAFEQARCNKHSFEDWYRYNYC